LNPCNGVKQAKMAGIEGDFWGIVAKNRLVASKTQLIGAGDAQI
tara:strand:+ start:254 stop:385 length:132 start_codon:yes stop_codon:yes gene_type:complete